MVRVLRFELKASWTPVKRDTKLRHTRIFFCLSLSPGDLFIIAQSETECKCFFRFFRFFQNFFPATPFPTPSVKTAHPSRCSPLANLAKNLILFSVLFSILSKRFFFLKCYKLFTISEKTFFFYFQPFHFPTVLRSDGRNFEGILLRSDNGQKEVAYL